MDHVFILFDGVDGDAASIGVFSTLDAAETGAPDDIEHFCVEEWELDGEHVETHFYGSDDEEE